MNEPTPDGQLLKLAAGAAGALVSLNFVRGTWTERLLMAASGAVVSYFVSEELATWLNVPKAIGMVGFFTGLFGMAIVSKLYEIVQMVDAKQIASDLWEVVKRKWGA
jgi:hypothetical protein